jgi:hypothetical protein
MCRKKIIHAALNQALLDVGVDNEIRVEILRPQARILGNVG